MRDPLGLVAPVVIISISTSLIGCSSSSDKTSQGSLAVMLGVSRRAAPARDAADGDGDLLGRVAASSVSISDLEARKADGTWVPTTRGLPAVVDLWTLVNGGRATLPPDLLPEGQYNALQLRINKVDILLHDGSKVAISPPGSGWVEMIPVDFNVAVDEATILTVNVALDRSLKVANGVFEFDPEIDFVDVAHP